MPPGAAEATGYAMDDLHALDLALFIIGTFAAAFVTGLAGFAFAIVAAAVWLHFLTPSQAVPLIVAFGLIVQSVSVWKLRRAVKLGRILPFVLGSAIGVPLGAALLRWTPAANTRMAIGELLVALSLYNWFRPNLAAASRAGTMADSAVGVLNGVIGGATGLAGIAAVVWCNLRGWPPTEQRAVFQPVGVATFVLIALWLGGAGMIGPETVPLFLLGLPALALGTWAGLKSFGRLNDATFRRIVLGLLLLSGVSLLLRLG
jgi:uncharacterized membrane protein YfcA